MSRFTVYRPTPPKQAEAAAVSGPGMGLRSRAVEILGKLPLFSGLLEGEYFKVLTVCSSLFLPEGEVLFREGDAGDHLYVLLSGEVAVVMEGRGEIHVMEPGEVLGEICLVCEVRRTASAVARKESVLLRMEVGALLKLLERNPRIGWITMKNVAATLARRLQDENQRQRLDFSATSS